jgi:membrane protease YdiL (CAAX protease family)
MGSTGDSAPETEADDARIPSVLQVLSIWLTAAMGILAAGLATAAVAAATSAAVGKSAIEALADPKTSPLVNSSTWISLGTVANEAAVLITLGVWLWLLKTPLRLALPLTRPSVLGVLGAVLLVFGLAPLAEVMGDLVHRLSGQSLTASRIVVNAARGATGPGVVLLVFGLGAMPALAEEALFRGLLTAPFERRFLLGLSVPSVLFGMFHLEPTQIAGTIVLGVAFAAARLCTGSLVTSMIAHFVYNTTVLLTVRYSDVLVERQLHLAPVLVGFGVAAVGAALLWRERRGLVAVREGGRASLPSWWL